MKHEQQIVIKRWVPILEEYEKTRTKQRPRVFKSLKALCEAHHISTKELFEILQGCSIFCLSHLSWASLSMQSAPLSVHLPTLPAAGTGRRRG